MNKKFILKFSFVGLMLVVLAVVCLIPFVKNKDKMAVYAASDSTILNASFSSSDIVFGGFGYCSMKNNVPNCSFQNLTSNNDSYSFFTYSFGIVTSAGSGNSSVNITFNFSASNSSTIYLSDQSSNRRPTISIDTFDGSSIGSFNYIASNPIKVNGGSIGTASIVAYSVAPESGVYPTLQMVTCEIGSSKSDEKPGISSVYTSWVSSYPYNWVRYVDNAGWSYVFIIPICSSSSYYNAHSNVFYTYRSYNFAVDMSDEALYQQGYNSGYGAGSSAGQQQGYDDGYSAGYGVGYSEGVIKGESNSNEYTFANLFGAVLDAPIKALTGLFNFSLLGVNLLGVITGLLTIAVIVFVIKLILGGK